MPTLAEVRAQFPQYSDMPDDVLADRLHKTFYADMPRDQFDVKIGLKPAELKTSTLEAFGRGGRQGATFGFGDELAGLQAAAFPGQTPEQGMARRAAIPMGMGGVADALIGAGRLAYEGLAGGDTAGAAYRQGRDADRALNAQAEQERPIASEAGNVVGGIGTAVATAPAAVGLTAAVPVVRSLPGVLRLAGVGAAEGGLAGAGGAVEGERAGGAAVGAGLGAGIGAAAPAVVGGVVRAARGIRNAFSPEAGAAADLRRAIARDADTPADLSQRLSDASIERPGATIADVGGENVRGVLERVAQTPGAGRTTVVPALTNRQRTQMLRVSGDLGELTGTTRTAFQAVEETMAQRAQSATPLYDEAYNFNARAVPELVREWQNATAQGWGRSVLNSANVRRNLQTEFGIQDVADAPLMVQIDLWQREMRDLAQKAGGNSGRVIRGLRDRVLGVADVANPAFPRARNAWAGPSQYLDEIEEGRKIMSPTMSAEELRGRLRNMSDAAREAYRIGAVSAIKGRMGNDPAKLADMTKYLRSPEMRDKVSAIMPTQEAAESWARRLDFEVRSSEMTGQALGNSATYRRQAERADADGIVNDLIADALAGAPIQSFLRRVVMAGPQRARDTLRSRSDAVLAEALTNPGADIDRLLRRTAVPPYRAPLSLSAGIGGAGAIEAERRAR